MGSRVSTFVDVPLRLLNSVVLNLIRLTKPVVDFASFLVNQEVATAVVEVEVQVRLCLYHPSLGLLPRAETA